MKRFLLLLALSLPLAAAELNPAEEQRYQALIRDIRCPTCQNSNIAESTAPLAKQLRQLVAEQIQAGRSDGEINAHLQARYGDFISYRPPLGWHTLLLWLGPFGLMAAVAAGVWWRWRRSGPGTTAAVEPAPPANGDEARAAPLPLLWAPLLALALALALGGWWTLSGAHYQRWQELTAPLAQPLNRARYLGELPDWLDANPLVFCVALQERVNRQDPAELATLGRCYQRGALPALARPVYARLVQLEPNSGAHQLALAQLDLLGQQQPLDAAGEARLQKLIAEHPTEADAARLLLAAAYERAGRSAEALPLWQRLAPRLPAGSEMKRLVEARLAAFRQTVKITVQPETLASQPANALLFLELRQGDKTLARRVLPLLPEQEALFEAGDFEPLPGPDEALRVELRLQTDGASPPVKRASAPLQNQRATLEI